MPIALVGKWPAYDLPQRSQDGSICLGYHAEKVKKGEMYKPHASNVWECRHEANEPDPRNFAPISLEVPPMTAEEEKQAKLWQVVNKIYDISKDGHSRKPLDVLLEIIRVLDKAAYIDA